jgi:hypothetical protein
MIACRSTTLGAVPRGALHARGAVYLRCADRLSRLRRAGLPSRS